MTDNQRKRKASNSEHNAANRLRQPFDARSSMCDSSLASYQSHHYGAPAAIQQTSLFDTAHYLDIDADSFQTIAEPPHAHPSLTTYQMDGAPAVNFEPYDQPASLYSGTSASEFSTTNLHSKYSDVDHNAINYRAQPHKVPSTYNESVANTTPQMAGPSYGTHPSLPKYPMVGAPAANLAPYDQLPSLFLDTHRLEIDVGDFRTTNHYSTHWNNDYNGTNYLPQPQNVSSIYRVSAANTSYATPQMVDQSHSAYPWAAGYQMTGAPSAYFGPYDQQVSLFSGAHHFGIDTATFNTGSTTNYITNTHSPSIDPYSILHNAIAIEATRTSKTAEYAPKCHPKTRTKIIADIVDMVETGEKPIIWFSGPAGGGKTCIMREVADCCRSKGQLTCTYFFSTRVPGLFTSTPFVATIANQLLEAIPPLRPLILNSISTYPTIFQLSLDFQMEKLIIEPLGSEHLRPSIPLKIVVVIDGYDECTDVKERQHLLRLLESLDEKVPQSIIIVIASRPELDIRTDFDKSHLKSITRPVLLHSYDGGSDVLTYLADEFEQIRQTHPRRAQIPEGWPVKKIVHTLIDKSSGNFILPSTTIKYISNLRENPVEMLKRVLAAFSLQTDDNPLAEIDALYTLVLHPPGADSPLMKRILHWIIAITKVPSKAQLSSTLLDNLLQLPSGTVEATLCDLHSVIKVPSPDIRGPRTQITFHHKSLEDFLLSSSRSRDLFQALYETQLDLALVYSQHLLVWAANPMCDFDDDLARTTLTWGDHVDQFLKAKPRTVIIPDTILQFDARIVARLSYVLQDDCRLSRFVLLVDAVPKSIIWKKISVPEGLYDEEEIDELSYPVGNRLLTLKLEIIRGTHPLKRAIPDDWHSNDISDTLVCRDQSDLLVPSLIVQYLKNPHHNPVDSLKKALSALSSVPPPSGDPEAQLDAIYALLLHPPGADVPLIKRLLHCMVGLSRSQELGRYRAASCYDRLFDLPAGASEAALSDINSVLFLFNGHQPFCPQSLEDYLLSPDRSKDMFQSEQETHLDITLAEAHLKQKRAELLSDPRKPDPLQKARPAGIKVRGSRGPPKTRPEVLSWPGYRRGV